MRFGSLHNFKLKTTAEDSLKIQIVLAWTFYVFRTDLTYTYLVIYHK